MLGFVSTLRERKLFIDPYLNPCLVQYVCLSGFLPVVIIGAFFR